MYGRGDAGAHVTHQLVKVFFSKQVNIARAVAKVARRRLRTGPRHPSWSLPFEVGVEVCGRVMDIGDEPIANFRRAEREEATSIPLPVRRRVDHGVTDLAGVPAEVHTPKAGSDRTLLYVHGGGYFACSPATHRELAARLAHATGARTFVPDYRKAPEHPFPAAIDDVERFYRALLGDGVAPERLVVAGDSAGGGLVLALVQRLRATGAPLPRRLVLLSPFVDMTARGGSMEHNGRYDYLPAHNHDRIEAMYLAGADPRDPLASPVHADLTGFPPILMLTGELELFYDQNLAFARLAREDGVSITHVVADATVHVYPLLAGVSPRARADIERIGAFVRA